jgi:HPt (histidine-containing phosphotransfer) domain-containing protein
LILDSNLDHIVSLPGLAQDIRIVALCETGQTVPTSVNDTLTMPLRPRALYDYVWKLQETLRILPDPEPLNRETVMERFSNDLEFYTEVLQTFVETSPALVQDISESVLQADGGRLSKASHTLRGAVSNFATGPAASLLSRLETCGKADNSKAARRMVPKLHREIDRLTDSLLAIKEEIR